MRLSKFMIYCLLALITAGAASGQSSSPGVNTGALQVRWTFDVDTYTFNVSNPIVEGRPYQIVAWTLEPFNIPAPVAVICPAGWEWQTKGAGNYFELAKSSEKYDVGGSALEPGESLTFKYTIGSSTDPVNSGGPVGPMPAFLSHIGAVSGTNKTGYIAYTTQMGVTWHEIASTTPVLLTPVPEPSSLVVIISGFFALGCLGSSRRGYKY